MFVLTPRRSATPALHRAVDRLFNESLEHVLGGHAADTPARTPAMDVSESDTAYTVVFDMPGAGKNELEVTVQGRRVSVQTSAPSKPETASEATPQATPQAAPAAAGAVAEATPATAADSQRVLYRERGLPRYARTVSLPAEVDQATSQARFEHGVLTLTLAKRVPTGATSLTVN